MVLLTNDSVEAFLRSKTEHHISSFQIVVGGLTLLIRELLSINAVANPSNLTNDFTTLIKEQQLLRFDPLRAWHYPTRMKSFSEGHTANGCNMELERVTKSKVEECDTDRGTQN